MSTDKKKLLEMYRTVVTIRQFETMAGEYFAAGQIPGFIHLSIGQEGSSRACAPACGRTTMWPPPTAATAT